MLSKRPRDAEDFFQKSYSGIKASETKKRRRVTMKTLKSIFISLLLCCTVVSVADAQTHYFDPAHPGHGVSVTRDSGQGNAFIWYLYNRSGEAAWLISTENCAEYPCVTGLARSNGTWMGGDIELEEVGTVFIDFVDGGMLWDYDVKDWPLSGDCGRLVMIEQNKCVGTFNMVAVD